MCVIIIVRLIYCFSKCFVFLSTVLAFRFLAFSMRISHDTIASIVYDRCEVISMTFGEKHMSYPSVEGFKTTVFNYERMRPVPNLC